MTLALCYDHEVHCHSHSVLTSQWCTFERKELISVGCNTSVHQYVWLSNANWSGKLQPKVCSETNIAQFLNILCL